MRFHIPTRLESSALLFCLESFKEDKSHISGYNSVNDEDFIDMYLNQIDGTKDSSSSFYKSRGLQSLDCVMIDLFLGTFLYISKTNFCYICFLRYLVYLHNNNYKAMLCIRWKWDYRHTFKLDRFVHAAPSGSASKGKVHLA